MPVFWKKLPLDTSPSIQADLPLEHNTTLPFNIYSFALASIFLRGCTYLPILIHLICRLDGGRECLAERPFERRKRSESRTNFLYFSLEPTYRYHHRLSALPLRMPSVREATASFLLFPFFPAYPFPFLSLLRLFPCLVSDVGWWPMAIGRSRNICWHDDAGHLFPYLIIYRGLMLYFIIYIGDLLSGRDIPLRLILTFIRFHLGLSGYTVPGRGIMPFKITDVYVLYRSPRHIHQTGDILQAHCLKQICYVTCKTMGITATACSKRYPFLLVIGTSLIHALIALYFHTDDCFLTVDGKADKIPDPIAVLDQMSMTAWRTYLLALFSFHM